MSWIHVELILPSSIWKLSFWQFWSPNLVDRRGGSNKAFPLSNGFCCFSISCFDKSVGTKWWWCSHLDHIGALPYFTEICGYEGPIYMTVSSKASSQWIVCWNSGMSRFMLSSCVGFPDLPTYLYMRPLFSSDCALSVCAQLFFGSFCSTQPKHWHLWCWRIIGRWW